MKTLAVWTITTIWYLQFNNAAGSCCRDGWITYKSHCYWVGYGERLTFVEAILYCFLRGAYLVRMDTATENSFLKDVLRKTNASDTWTGLNDLLHEGIWRYLNAEYAGFSDWGYGEPNNYNSKEDCVHFRSSKDYKWNSKLCTVKMQPLCEAHH